MFIVRLMKFEYIELEIDMTICYSFTISFNHAVKLYVWFLSFKVTNGKKVNVTRNSKSLATENKQR